ncbi:MAG TPA: hypothetical protein VK110_09465 [Salinisphaeraceae bacterium]|nr:hypothetical protein [Salinisphaeraceae bacterium]
MNKLHGEYKIPGGKLVQVDLLLRDEQLAEVQVSGDFFLEPPEAIAAINAALEGQPASADEDTLAASIQAALPADVAMYGITPEGVAVAVRRALEQDGQS